MHFHDDPLDHEFPLGDGTAEMDAVVICPYCAEPNSILLEPGSGPRQEYVEDCQICCQSWRVRVVYRQDGSADVEVETADGR